MRKSFAVRRMLFAVSCGALLTVGSAQGGTVGVTNTNDNLAGSLRQALQDASPGDTIVFQIPTSSPGYNPASGIYVIGLTSGELVINKDLTIDPAGQKIWVQRASGNFRIFNVTSGEVTILALTIRNPTGGGILNNGNLTVRNCTFTDNDPDADGFGGAIHNTGTLRVSNCTFSGNVAGASGTAISNSGDMTLENSTIVGNQAPAASSDGAAVYGGGTATRVRNTIIVGNTRGATARDVSGSFASEGYNLIGSTTGSTGFGATGDQLGAAPAAANLTVLQDNGGPTQTMRPMSGSVAIDQGKRGLDANNQPINNDQRGSPRPVELAGISNAIGGDASDIGAVETGLPQTGPTFTVTNMSAHFDASCTLDDCTLADAIDAANNAAEANTINFAGGLSGEIKSPSNLNITNPVTIQGPGARIIALNGSDTTRGFNINTAGNVTISGLTMTHCRELFFNLGGAMYHGGGGILTLLDCAFILNSTPNTLGGGAIFNDSGNTLIVTRCTFLTNSTKAAGGAIYNLGIATLTNCTLVSNVALNGGAVISKANGGASSLTLRNCTVVGNDATDTNTGGGSGGGGIYAEGASSQYHFANNIIALNESFGVNPDLRGNITSDGHNLIGYIGSANIVSNGSGDQIGNGTVLNPRIEEMTNNGGDTDTIGLSNNSTAINAGDDVLAPATDQRGYLRSGVSDIGAFEFDGALPTPTPTPTATPGLVGNVSTRLPVGTGDNVLIEGFIVQGPGGSTKKIMVRAIGPSLVPFGVTDALANPTLEIRDASNTLIASNNDWGTTQVGGIIIGDQSAEIGGSGLSPGNGLESAIIADLAPGSYTAVVRGVGDSVGTGVVDAYDLSPASSARLANIATRGLIQPGDQLMIAGFIIQNGPVRALILAVGPSLSAFGINNALPDTTLQLRDQNGVIVLENDDWQSDQKAEIEATGLQPSDPREAAMVVNIPPGQYTAQVRGKPEQTGIGVVQVYFLR